MEPHSVARLLGAPPGYIGHDEGGQLTEAVRRKPYSVILFDEIEKAHTQIWNVLLQVLDDGRLTDSKGRTVNFTNTIIILTSNIGSTYLLEGYDPITNQVKPAAKASVMNEVQSRFKPEFLNRLDSIVMFEPLNPAQLEKIVQLQLESLSKRLADQDISLHLSARATQSILRQSYNPIYGARPLKRFLEKKLTTELSKLIIAGELPPHSNVEIDIVKNRPDSFDFVVIPKKEEERIEVDMDAYDRDTEGGTSSSSSSTSKHPLRPTSHVNKPGGTGGSMSSKRNYDDLTGDDVDDVENADRELSYENNKDKMQV